MKYVERHVTWFDHLLAATASMLAVYAAAGSIGRPSMGMLLAGAVALAYSVGYYLGRAMSNTRLIKFDGIFYTLAACAALFFAGPLNAALPEGGFPRQIIFTGIFGWMTIFGALVSWRDQTLSFQMVPSIAIFGLVGAFDYRPAPFMFFAFLICAATLFFRAHARSMMQQAVDALAGGQAARTKAKDGQLVARAFEMGAWRWMAGPEWAIGSALAIVLLSLIGAPVLQESVKGVTEAVRVTLPSVTPPSVGNSNRQTGGALRLGRGPASFIGQEMLEVKVETGQYLRGRTYDTYLGGSWDSRASFPTSNTPDEYFELGNANAMYQPSRVVPGGRENPFVIRIIGGTHASLYSPGEPLRIDSPVNFRTGADGSMLTRSFLSPGNWYRGIALVPQSPNSESQVASPPQPGAPAIFLNTGTLSDRVRELAIEATRGARNDYERARLIQSEISTRCKYNLRARAVPPSEDAVAYFLFNSKEGYCDLFASAMTMMARSIGLPSRVATGYLVNSPALNAEGFSTVYDRDAHVWTEIYFEGIGWVTFDATEGATEVRNEDDQDRNSWLTKERVSQIIDYAIYAALAAVAIIVLRSFVRKRTPREPQTRTEAGEIYERFQRMLERQTGKPRRFCQTPAEYIDRIAGDLGQAEPEARRLSVDFERAFYGPDDPTAEDLQGLKGRVKELKSQMRKAS